MSRINTNVASLYAQQGLAQSQQSLNTTLQRLSTGLRINSGADDPAGLIASQQLKAEMTGISQAVSNSQRANNVIATAEGALNEVSSLLQSVKGLVVQAANTGAMSADEIAANQLQLDSAVQSITRISETTTFAGLHLIDGSLSYLTSGLDSNAIGALDISQANLGTNTSMPVQVNVLTSAQQANLEFTASSIAKSVTLEVTGNNGTQTLTFTSGTAASAIAYAINTNSDSTGVVAKMNNTANAASGIAFSSSGFGSQSFVSVQAQTGTFATTDTKGNSQTRVVGRDAVATVNGALTVGNGLELKLNTSSLDLDMTLSNTFGAGKTSFAITGGGALFQLGAQVASNQQVSIGIASVAANHLGNADVGFLSDVVTGGSSSLVSGKAAAASQIIDAAINQVSILSGRLGAFQADTLNTNINSLNVALENVTSANSTIADADFAAETANLTRAQILVQAGTTVLSTANSAPQTVLALLQGH
ncbi:MAG TPA: flagellin [Tepidisphaeraceae bacterium]|jgi:flagellin|nr:flagellin [Tepidisphaeraceae bacterium]